jgi:hypothetical protein
LTEEAESLFEAACFFFDPTGQNPSISIKETANVYK